MCGGFFSRLRISAPQGFGRQVVAQLLADAPNERLESHLAEDDLLGTRKVQEVRHDLSEGFGLLSNAFDIRTIPGWQLLEI